ncbi:tyrosine-protein kinase Fer-like [Huso huso]|uniref:Tyrosine-protein kinase n=1 Tax=Huso huso TaxID=61971 RepID=A0ABR0ZS77_HUSHU
MLKSKSRSPENDVESLKHWQYPEKCGHHIVRAPQPIQLPAPLPLVPEVERPLCQQVWFHGALSRQDAEWLLQKEGDFLVREGGGRSREEVVLSVRSMGQGRHFIIQSIGNAYCFEPQGSWFYTVPLLIEHHVRKKKYLTKKSRVTIRAPVLKVKWELEHEDIVMGELIGSGNFSEVFSGRLASDNTPVAVKLCRDGMPREIKSRFIEEARILQQYDHPNIVHLIGVCALNPVCIVMELVTGGDFLSFLRSQGGSLYIRDVLKFAEQAAAGMAYLESKNCIHRDLAARNCLVSESSSVLKISDFGMSREVEDGVYCATKGGMKHVPIKWTAPEALKFGRYTTESDVWSYGILLWETFSLGATPYTGMTNQQAREKVERGFRMRAPRFCPSEVYDVMLRCWDARPAYRPSFFDIHCEIAVLLRKMKSCERGSD